jgi:DNA-binding response OmpR family regulator
MRPPPILIIDNDVTLRDLLVEFLAEEGYRATGLDGSAAPAAIQRERPALLLLDVRMPGLDGPALCRLLRADPRTQSLPVVFVTALPEHTLAPLLVDCGATGYLGKPFTLGEVLATVRCYLPPLAIFEGVASERAGDSVGGR